MPSDQPSPTSRVWFSGFFGAIGVIHLVRAIAGWPLNVAGRDIPVTWSVTIGIAALVVSLSLFFLGRRQRTSPPNLP